MTKNPLFLDFEASSLSPMSWPIEIGLTQVNRDTQDLVTQSKLINRYALWNKRDWSLDSQKIHNITPKMLNSADDAQDVARWALDIIKDHILISDAPPFEAHWLSRLCQTINAPLPEIVHMHLYFYETLSSKGLDIAFEHIATSPKPHRAGPDSAIMAMAWLKGLKTDAGDLHYGP